MVNVLGPYAKKLEEVTEGRVKVTMYPAQTLCKMPETLTATQTGLADIAWVIMGAFPGRFPLSSVMSLPFVNLDAGTVDGRTLTLGGINSHIYYELYEKYPEMQAEWGDWKVLFVWSSGPLDIFTVDKPVRNQADLKGLKIRALAGGETDMYKLLGASPLFIGTPDIYGSLEKGVLEAISQGWGPITAYRLYEHLRYTTEVGTTNSLFGLIMNKEKWNSLAPDIQEAIMSVSAMSGAEFAGEAEWGVANMNAHKAKVKETGYVIEEVSLDPGERERWEEIAGKPLWDKWVADTEAKGLPGQKVLDEAFRLIEKYK